METDEFVELAEIMKEASSLMPVTFNRVELAALTAQLEEHMQAIDSLVMQDIYSSETTLSNIETLSNIYNSLLSEKQSLNAELDKVLKQAMEIQSLFTEAVSQRANLSRLADLFVNEAEAKESEYSKLAAGMNEMELELEKFGMSLMDFLQLPLRTPSDAAVERKLSEIAEKKLKEMEKGEEENEQ